MKCVKCGAKNADDAKFCKKCANPLGTAGSPEDVTIVSDKINLTKYVVNNRFRVLKKLGQGGMGEVLLGEDVKLKRKVAIKSIIKENSDDSTKLRFLREAQTASQLDHPNICTIYEIYEEADANKSYIVMQYVDGVTLGQIIAMKRLNIDRILDIAGQVCTGMAEAHSKNVIHRDIKPGNIMIDQKGVVKILDFGLAKFSDPGVFKDDGAVNSNLTEKGFVLGTVAYISPEQARGKPLDQRSDIFSFGLVMYEMLEGRNPFKRDEQIETLYNVLNKEIEFAADVPDELKRIVRKALQKDRDARYTDFNAISEDLLAFKERYEKIKNRKPEGGATEVINVKEQAEMLDQIQKTSDIEDLANMVYRLKKYKASTERVVSAKRRKPHILWIIPLILALTAAGYYFLIHQKLPVTDEKKEMVYVYLHPFENNTKDRKLKELPQMLDFLLTESLNQFSQFKTINRGAALPIAGKPGEDGNKTVDLEQLKKRFNIRYQLKGKISKQGDVFTIDADLVPLDPKKQTVSITGSGSGLDSILKNQLNLIARRVFSGVVPGNNPAPVKSAQRIFGNSWEKFIHFYRGYQYYKKLNNGMAEFHFLKATDIIICKYYLADVYYFDGERKKALQMVEEIKPYLAKLPRPLQLKVKAIKARLHFQFNYEIKHLEDLKNEFLFSKEIFLQLGEAHFHHANAEEAIRYYRQALDLDPRYSKALNHLGYSYSYIGNHQNAINAFENYRNLDGSKNSFDSLGDGYFYAGYLEDALAMKKSAAAPDKDKRVLSYAYQTMADIYILKAQYRDARKALRTYRILEDNEKDAIAYTEAKSAFIYYINQKRKDALIAINNSLQKHDSKDIKDHTAEIHWLKGLILLASGKINESKKELNWLAEFKDNYRLDKDNFHAGLKYYIHLDALIAEHEGRAPSADKQFKRLIDMKSKLSYWITYYNYQFFHTEYAKYLDRNGKYEQALKEIDQCLTFNPNYIPALWLKAGVLDNLNRESQAMTVYDRIQELYGDAGEVNYKRNLLKMQLDR